MPAVTSQTIKTIFTNLLFVIGVILTIYGFVVGTLTAVRLITFSEYPLNSYDEMRCEIEVPMIAKDVDTAATPTQEQQQEQRQRCQTTLQRQRQVRQTEHVVTAITTLIAGGVLMLVFKRYILS